MNRSDHAESDTLGPMRIKVPREGTIILAGVAGSMWIRQHLG